MRISKEHIAKGVIVFAVICAVIVLSATWFLIGSASARLDCVQEGLTDIQSSLDALDAALGSIGD